MKNLTYKKQVAIIEQLCNQELQDTVQIEKILALVLHLELKIEDLKTLKKSDYSRSYIEYYDEEYMILTDDEANKEYEEYIENAMDDWLEDVIKEEIKYSKWQINGNWLEIKMDILLNGRDDLDYYYGIENEECVNGTTYYIYRRN